MGTANHVLALDQGTTSSRAMVFDQFAREISVARRPTTQLYPHPGWVNQDAAEIWITTLQTAQEALRLAGLTGADLAGVGIVNQRETLVVWDRETSEPSAPAIVWQSRQSQPQVDALLTRGLGPAYQRKTGLVPDAYFTASKLAWLLEDQPDVRRRAEAGDLLAGTVDSWLLWNLTGGEVHATDVSNASRTMLFDIETLEWSAEILKDMAIPLQMLPRVVSSAGVTGLTAPDLFGAEIPVSGIAGDQQAALFGQTCFASGEAKNTYGTGSFLLMNTGSDVKRSDHRLLSTIAWGIEGRVDYALEGSVFICGAAVEWLRDGLGIIDSVQDVESLAASVPDVGGVTVVPAFTGLGAPHWDAAARGTILGLTRGSTAAHIARATLEAITFQSRDVIDAMIADSGIPLTSLRVDGGAARNDLLMQIQADVLGVSVIRPQNVETTAVGAAFLAGLGCGLWPDQASLADRWAVDRVFEPALAESERQSRYAIWRQAVERARGWAV
jgi:glycerol kinase